MDNQALYQQVIIDHARKPRHCYRMKNPTHMASGKNPVCGDDITVYIELNDSQVLEVSFEGSGCAICMASASMMSEHARGKSKEDVLKVIHAFIDMQTHHDKKDYETTLGKCSILEGVKHYPLRIKCATLAWHALKAAVESDKNSLTVSTE